MENLQNYLLCEATKHNYPDISVDKLNQFEI